MSRDAFAEMLENPEDLRLQAHEVIYMTRVYDRVSAQKMSLGIFHPSLGISVGHFIVGLTMVSPVSEPREKMALFFEAFDNDYDKCLLYHEIHEMCRCVCALRPVAEESSRSARDETFQAEL
eukprot:CAMPEP_0115163404 /NCGR_PEP_ID=MMETSP0227-20121206/72492_1 /TAXON_ID=89957 /ORGANISM="Polarella glacialis, Strain CCMP 1383" /LENGTH=121 /DNA_ID=CAMNT_0002575709 /DNA_START=48 /DNA_END=410 /DNA_ORIENTATION=+